MGQSLTSVSAERRARTNTPAKGETRPENPAFKQSRCLAKAFSLARLFPAGLDGFPEFQAFVAIMEIPGSSGIVKLWPCCNRLDDDIQVRSKSAPVFQQPRLDLLPCDPMQIGSASGI